MGFASQSPRVFIPFVAAVLPAVFQLGLVTVVRLVDTALENMQYLAGIARIRRYYRTLTPDAESYFALDIGRWPEARAAPSQSLGPSFALLGTTAAMIGFANNIVAGVVVTLGVNALLDNPAKSISNQGVQMLNDKEAIATVAVKDLKVAAKFYEELLGLKRKTMEGEEVITYRTGSSSLNVYRSDYARTNQATAVTWAVGDDLEAIALALKAKGVTFEHYDAPGMTRQGDVHMHGDMKVAWFKDPDGNILNLIGR